MRRKISGLGGRIAVLGFLLFLMPSPAGAGGDDQSAACLDKCQKVEDDCEGDGGSTIFGCEYNYGSGHCSTPVCVNTCGGYGPPCV